MAKVYAGARLRVVKKGRSKSCPHGWLGREGGGFICSKYLKKVSNLPPSSSPEDAPNLLAGLDAYEVVGPKGPRLYRSLKDLERRRPLITLDRTSTVVVKKKMEHGGKTYLQTRLGWYLEDRQLRKLPAPIDTLGVDIPAGNPPPLGIIISDNAKTFASPNSAESIGHLERWSVVELPKNKTGADAVDGKEAWVSLGPDNYLEDSHIARYRPPPFPRRLAADERWLAVDVREQLVHAYEGKRLVRLMPCSTGKRGNTVPGNYRIQWKRRAQTMRLRQGRIRVEDVQWVMYYHRKQGIAIHSAYWHHSFGTPVSHGCVNLPHLDARWVFEWTTPGVIATDSERFPVPGDPGSRVVVFKKSNW